MLEPEVGGSEAAAWIGLRVRDLELPEGCLVAMIRRGRESIVPQGATVLAAGDRLTLIGRPDAISALRQRWSAAGRPTA